MIAASAAAPLLLAPFFAAAGAAFGWSYFAALWRGVAVHAVPGGAWRCAVWLLARLAAAALFFTLCAHWGAWPLLAAFLGFVGFRHVAVRAARRAV